MAYDRQYWKNRSKATPISAERLNYMEDGIYSADLVANKAAEDIVTINLQLNDIIECVNSAMDDALLAKERATEALDAVDSFQEQLTETKELAQAAKTAADEAKAKAEVAYAKAYTAESSVGILRDLVASLSQALDALTLRVEKLEEDAADETCVVLQAKKVE